MKKKKQKKRCKNKTNKKSTMLERVSKRWLLWKIGVIRNFKKSSTIVQQEFRIRVPWDSSRKRQHPLLR